MTAVRKGLFVLGAMTLFLFILLGIIPFLLQAGPAEELLRKAMEAELRQALKREVRIQRLSLKPFLGALELRGLTLFGDGELAQVPILEVERLRLTFSLQKLLHRTLVVEQAALQEARFLVKERETPQATDLSDLLNLPTFALRFLGVPFQLQISTVLVNQGQLRYLSPRLGLEGVAKLKDAQIRWNPGSLRSTLAFGPIELRLAGKAFSLEEAKAALEGDGGGITLTILEARAAESTAAMSGRLAVAGEETSLHLRFTSRLRLEQLAHFVKGGLKAEGLLQLQGVIAGKVSSPSLEGQASLAEGTLEGLPFRDLAFQFRYREGGLTIVGLKTAMFGGRLEGEGRLFSEDQRFQGEFRFERMVLSSLLDRLWHKPSPLRGELKGRLKLKGEGFKARDVQGEARLLIENLRGDGEEMSGRLEASVALDREQVKLLSLSLRQGSSAITAKGFVSMDGASDLTVQGTVRRVSDLGTFLGMDGLGGSATVQGRLQGSWERPRFAGTINWQKPRLFAFGLERASGTVELSGGRLKAQRLLLRQGRTTLEVQGEALLGEGRALTHLDLKRDITLRLTLKGEGRLEDLASFSPHKLPIAGSFQGRASLEGIPSALIGGTSLQFRQMELLGESWEKGEAVFVLEPGRLSLQRFSLHRGKEEVVGLGEVRGESYAVQLWSRALDLGRLKPLAGTGVNGTIQVTIQGWGRLADPYFTGRFGVAALSYRDLALGAVEGNFAWRGGALFLDLSLREGHYRLRSLLSAKTSSYQAELTLSQASLDPFLKVVGDSPLQTLKGEASGRVRLRGLLGAGALAGVAELSSLTLFFQGQRWQNVGPVLFSWQGSQVTLSPIRMGSGGKEFTLQGSLEVERRLQLKLEGSLPLVAVKPFIDEIAFVEGVADVALDIGGPWHDVEVRGRIATGKAKLRLSFLPWLLEDVQGALVLEKEGVHGEGLKGSLAGGRTEVQWIGRRDPKGWFHTVIFQLQRARAERVFGEPRWTGLITGQLSAKGRLFVENKKGRDDVPLSTLEGEFSLDILDGNIKRFTVLSRIFSLLNPTMLLEFKLPDLTSTGMNYKSLKGDFTVKRGVAETEDLFLDSLSLRMGAVGKLDLVKEEVDFKVGVRPLQTFDKVLSSIPLIGRVLTGKEKSLVVSYYEVKGKTLDPQVKAIPFESLGRGILGVLIRVLTFPYQMFSPSR
ncbi:MAG: AsmA-like C-terminal domain-containing protein [candidate division NC10 bacterium]|nr:AsmA-like C-terminal domain-containing protein [candidate division NC10 bacterium]